MKALIKIGTACNNRCGFCHASWRHPTNDTAEGVHRRIKRAAELGHTMVVLSGGEPTIRPELLRWAAHCRALGMRFGLVTNGRMLSYETLSRRLLRRGLAYVYLSLHAGSSALHDQLVGTDAFEQSFAAVRVLSGHGLDLTVNCVVSRANLDHLTELVDRLLPFDDVVLKLSMVEPRGGALEDFEALVPRVSDVAERVRQAIAYGVARSTGLSFAHDGIPFCLLPGLEHRYDDLRTHGFATMSEVDEPDLHPVDDVGRVHTEPCADCRLRGLCPGLYQGYMEARSDDELRPVAGPRANAFHYVHERDLAWPENGAGCPVAESGAAPYDPRRQLFVRDGERLGIYRTHTRDFSDSDIARTTHARGQVYLDVSAKPAVDDFATDLRRLEPLEVCGTCPVRVGCPGGRRALASDVFARDDQLVAEHLGGLDGDVLDIGCGHGRYAELLSALAEAGRIRYVAVEPEASLAEAFRQRHPWATVLAQPIESVALEPESFDHVLVLRSYNHLPDPQAVLTRLSTALRPGGSMLVVDNVPFAMVRTREQARRAETSDAGFEHHHNHGAEDALRLLRGTPLHLISSRPVRPETSNQWALLLERAG